MSQGFGFGVSGVKAVGIYVAGDFATTLNPSFGGTLPVDDVAITPKTSGVFSVSSFVFTGALANLNNQVSGGFQAVNCQFAGQLKAQADFNLVAGSGFATTLSPQLSGALWILDAIDVPDSRTLDVPPIDRTILVIGDDSA